MTFQSRISRARRWAKKQGLLLQYVPHEVGRWALREERVSPGHHDCKNPPKCMEIWNCHCPWVPNPEHDALQGLTLDEIEKRLGIA